MARTVAGVTFTGWVDAAGLADLYAACDVFAAPIRSRWFGLEQEGLGLVLLEAQAAGKPVVAGRSGGTVEAVEDGQGGVLVNGGSAREVVGALADLLRDEATRRRLGSAGRVNVRRHFSESACRRTLLGHLTTIASDGAPDSEF